MLFRSVKFTTDYRMPHLLGSVSGTISVPNVATFMDFSEDGTTYVSAEDVRNFDVVTVSQLASGETFLSPFFTVSAGDIATGGMSLVGAGSSILRVFRSGTTGSYIGSMILTPLITGAGAVRVQVKSAVDSLNDIASPYSFYYSGGPDGYITGTSLTITYKIYYGRFQ